MEQPPAEEQAPAQQDDIAAFESEPQQAQEPAPPIEEVPGVAQNEPPPPIIEPQVEVPPQIDAVVEPTSPTAQLVNIKNIKYKANDNGGAIVIDADGPIAYTTRANPDTNQFIIEIKDSKLPDKLKRPYNTKDMAGGIGAIDAYQNNGSSVTRVVVQLRPGVAEPTVQNEGNSLLVVASNPTTQAQSLTQNQSEDVPVGETGLADPAEGGTGDADRVATVTVDVPVVLVEVTIGDHGGQSRHPPAGEEPPTVVQRVPGHSNFARAFTNRRDTPDFDSR